MIKTIRFKDNFGEYQDDAPYIIAVNDLLSLAFDFSANIQKPKKLKAVYAAGTSKSKIFDVSDGILQIPYEFFENALALAETKELCLELHEFTETGFEVNVGRYKVEPLAVTRIDEGLQSYALIQVLRGQIATLNKKVEDLTKTVTAANKSSTEQSKRFAVTLKSHGDSLSETGKRLKSTKIALLQYLYRHYRNDLRDSDLDLSLVGFCNVIGIDTSDLTKEELDAIEDFRNKENIL